MKLIFLKDENNEISLQLQRGATVEDFTYVEMVRQLLERNTFEDTDFGNLSDEEQGKIQTMLDKINKVFEEESNVSNDLEL